MESIRRLHEEILKESTKRRNRGKKKCDMIRWTVCFWREKKRQSAQFRSVRRSFPEKFADLNAVREVLLTPEKQVYALIAPAFMGQLERVSQGAIRAALKRAGFSGMVEVAVFADILTFEGSA